MEDMGKRMTIMGKPMEDMGKTMAVMGKWLDGALTR
jgi:hypothetical protein